MMIIRWWYDRDSNNIAVAEDAVDNNGKSNARFV